MQHTAAQVRAYSESLSLNIREWQDSPLPNLCHQSFLSTYPYNYKDSFSPHINVRQFEAMCLENEYLKATIVPALGVRLFSLFDKVMGKHVFNMPSGIFPSPIYLRGAYFPVGVEFNFPSGHSVHAAEYVPCEYTTWQGCPAIVMHVYNAVSHIHTELTFSLRPGERLLRMQVRFKNTLPVRNGFMYWANPAIENTPELTFLCKAPMCHFFDKYSSFPYIEGKDFRISKNRRFASDLFAIGGQEEWFGFYVPERTHGCLHISPITHMKGKKAFTWGFDDYAFRWARHYGCSEYGYVEIQAGILETQFEYLHLEPYEEKTIDEIWFPFNDIAQVSFANENCIFSDTKDTLNITSSCNLVNLQCLITCSGKQVKTSIASLTPGQTAALNVPDDFNPSDYELLLTGVGQTIIAKAVIRPVIPATDAVLEQKQHWLDLQPIDNPSTLEIATRNYNARKFDKAQMLAESLTNTKFASEAHRLLAEIYYVKDDLDSCVRHAKLLNTEGEILLQAIGAKTEAHMDVSPLCCDSYCFMGTIDRLANCGRVGQARHSLSEYLAKETSKSACDYYLMAYLENSFVDESTKIAEYLNTARHMTLEHANPFTKSERRALEFALKIDNRDSSALYLLGNYWLNKDKCKSNKYWQDAIACNSANYLAIRNLAFSIMRERRDIDRAVTLYQQALAINQSFPQMIAEYTIALRLAGQTAKALDYLDRLPPSIANDYRILKSRISILRDNYKFNEAIQLISNSGNTLFFWEGEHSTHRCYLECLMALGNQMLELHQFEKAIHFFTLMLDYPDQLMHSKSYDENQSAAYYHIGLTHEQTGNTEKALEYYNIAVNQPYPNLHHAVSYRENEYYAAKAAQKINDKKSFNMIVDRLTGVYDDDFDPYDMEFMPTNTLYANHLAAARGFMLIGEYGKTRKCLENLKLVYGVCWPYEQMQAELSYIHKCIAKL